MKMKKRKKHNKSKSNYFDKHYSHYNKFYDKLASKYSCEDESSWWPEALANEEPISKSEKLSRSRRKLISALQDIANNSGFNTNAPDEMYASARKLFDDLTCNLDDRSKTFEANKAAIKDAEWALFNKFDYMRAKELINGVK